MIVPELLAAHTAYLLGVLRLVGTGLSLRPPHQVLVGLQGLRLWSLLDGAGDGPVEPRVLRLPGVSSVGPE